MGGKLSPLPPPRSRAYELEKTMRSKNRNSDASTNFGCGCPEPLGGCPIQHWECPGTPKSIQIDTYAYDVISEPLHGLQMSQLRNALTARGAATGK